MSFVQFNLLPDVKLEFDRIQKTKHFVFTLAALASAIVAALFILSFLFVNVLQKKLLSDADKDITRYSQQLKGIKDLDKILTIQNQLSALPGLHQQKHITSRLLGYLQKITPTNAHIGKLNLDTAATTISITGTADSVESVNKFVDTMKFTSFTTNSDDSSKKLAFSQVVLSKVDRNDNVASYTITANYDAALFDAAQTVSLVVPQEITTRSLLNSPKTQAPLFNGETGEPDSAQPRGGQ